jgi:ABC-type oligopeptide transport system ATPase subunit
MSDGFLQVQNLKTHFPMTKGFIFRRHVGTVRAVDGVSLELNPAVANRRWAARFSS